MRKKRYRLLIVRIFIEIHNPNKSKFISKTNIQSIIAYSNSSNSLLRQNRRNTLPIFR
ncbi:hypothetical protein MtrunA17_Chr7g0260031 [Medicago truncatula]|uniref:Uncharacterized protein n=1 Tax=Medicago truncatula TaxID=3880 RepID=A0A396H5S5_MEDTR|nr:hypothetical protein MtrunA17_Chr7g0260031 [Medicago truncatula]